MGLQQRMTTPLEAIPLHSQARLMDNIDNDCQPSTMRPMNLPAVNFPGNADGDTLVNPLTATGRYNPY